MDQVQEILPIMVDATTSLRTINFYLVKTDSNLVLVDAGLNNDASKEALVQTLKVNGLELKDITEIILTHNHYDHVGLVNPITEKYSIPVYAHADAIPRLKRDRAFFEMRAEFYTKLYEEMGCGEAGDKHVAYLRESIEKNSHQAIQAEITEISDAFLQFNVIEVPGHAPDQIALYHREKQALFAGDLIIEHISSNALIEPDFKGKRLPTLTQHKRSLERIKKLNLNCIYSGHGKIIENPDDIIHRRLDGIKRKVEKIKNVIDTESMTANEIAKRFYKKSYETQFSLVMSEIIGHLDYMEQNEQLIKEMKNGVWYYSILK